VGGRLIGSTGSISGSRKSGELDLSVKLSFDRLTLPALFA
jgi:hypothetical protein